VSCTLVLILIRKGNVGECDRNVGRHTYQFITDLM